MKLALQYGYGMKDLCKDLLPNMRGSTIILSPRDLSDKQIISYSNEFIALGGQTLIDSQLYAPHSDHKRLTSHSYWPQDFSTGLFTNIKALKDIVDILQELNYNAGTCKTILPGIFCPKVERTWKFIQSQIFTIDKDIDRPTLITLALSSNVIQDQSQIDDIINFIAEECDSDGVYLLAEHPDGEYLVSNPIWIINLLHLVAALKRLNKYVIVGYTNHQMLCLSLAMADEMASGTWMNVRSFSLTKFFESSDIKRKNIWYYCPQALTEYTPAFLDIAFQEHKLPPFKPSETFSSFDYSSILFSEARPSSTAFGDNLAFRHYLSCLSVQCDIVSSGRFSERFKKLCDLLLEAKRFLQFAHSHSITGQMRDFNDYIDVVESAINTFYRVHGALLSRIW